MHIDIYVTTNGPYKVEFLNSDYSQMNNPYIAPQTNMVPVSGKLSVPAPSGTYTIPLIKVTNLTDGVVSMAYAYPVHCGANPTPTAPPTPVAPPTPIYIPPAPTPVAACTDCVLYTIYPTGLGPFSTWTVNYRDCNNVFQSTSGNGLDSPRERNMCVGSISIVGDARVESQGIPVGPTPTAPTPTPPFSGRFSCSALDSYLNSSSSVYSNNYSAAAYKNSSQFYLKESGDINENSVLSIMSLTKTITAAVIFKLRELGLLDLNTPIYNYLPEYLSYGSKKDITLRMILGHTTGLPSDTPYEQDTNSSVLQAANLIGQNSELSFIPGTGIQYSSAAYQLAAAIAEKVTLQSFKSLCSFYIFNPLGINTLRWTTTPNLGQGDNTSNNPIAGYGLSMSMSDYGKFVKSLAGYGVQILNQPSRDLMFSDATGNLDPYFGYGVLRKDVSGGSNVIDIHMKGASGCYGFINSDTLYCGVVFSRSGIENVDPTNEMFSSVVRENLGSCGNTPTPVAPTPVTPTPTAPPTPVSGTPIGPPPSTPTPIAPPPSSGYVGGQKFIVNGTGNSIDFSEATGISPNKVNLFTRMIAEGVDGVRHAFKLGDYYNGGNYRDQKLMAAINWVTNQRSDVFNEHLVVPVFTQNDNWLTDNDLWKDADGHDADCTFNFAKVPSYFSPNSNSKKAEIYHHYFGEMKTRNANIRKFIVAGGPSEEHYMTFSANYPGGPGCGNDKFGGVGDYSYSAQQAWKSYQTAHWSGLLPFLVDGVRYGSGYAPLPYIRPDSQSNRFVDLYRRDHREAIRFWNSGVIDCWRQFVAIGRQYFPNAEFESFVADMYNSQGIKYLMNAGAMHTLMNECDVWYHTEHLSPWEWAKCLVGVDIVKGGTYSGKKASMETDSTDAGQDSGANFDEALLEAKLVAFLDRGGDYMHWALDWSNNQIEQIGRIMRKIKAERINNPSYIPSSIAGRANADTVTLNTANMWTDTDYIYTVWESTGNSRSNPFASKLMNIRVHDGFYLDEQQ